MTVVSNEFMLMFRAALYTLSESKMEVAKNKKRQLSEIWRQTAAMLLDVSKTYQR